MPDPQEEKVIKETDELNQFHTGYSEAMRRDAEFTRHEEGRLQGKQGLRNMIAYYKGIERGDEKLASIMDRLEELAAYDVTSDDNYWKESEAFADAMHQMDRYIEDLETQEEELHEVSKQVFYKDGEWLSEEFIDTQGTPALQEMNQALNTQQNKIDDKRRLISDLHYYLESQTEGTLLREKIQPVKDPVSGEPVMADSLKALTEEDNKKIDAIFNSKTPVEWHDSDNYDYIKPCGEKTVVNAPTRFIDATNKNFDVRFYGDSERTQEYNRTVEEKHTSVNRSDRPLFPHEPCMNDISQGALGDCYYVASLANIAEKHPEKIREMMEDNGDGTVTVRLFSKNQKGEYAPVYVKVDKVEEALGEELADRHARNSLWAVCMERALVASGLMAQLKNNNKFSEPVPANIEAVYQKLKEKQDAGLLVGDNLTRAKDAYPWLFVMRDNQEPKLAPWPSMATVESSKAGLAMEALLGPGYEPERLYFPTDSPLGTNYTGSQNEAYDQLKYCLERDMPISASILKGSSPDLPTNENHAFTVLEAYEHEGVRYVRVRNPHGTGNEAFETEIKKDGSINVKEVEGEQSIFDVEFSVFCRNFQGVFVNGYHRDEYTMENPENKKERIFLPNSEEGPMTLSDSAELIHGLKDSSLIRDPEGLGTYLSQAPIAGLAEQNFYNGKDFANTGDEEFSTPESWRKLMGQYMTDFYPEYENGVGFPGSVLGDLEKFRKDLQDVVDESVQAGGSNQEIMEALSENLVKSKEKLISEGKDPEMERFLTDFYDRIRERTDALKSQVEKGGPLRGEEETNRYFDEVKARLDNPAGPQKFFVVLKPSIGNYREVTRLFRDEKGTMMMGYKYGNGERLMKFNEVMRRGTSFIQKDLRIEASKGLVEIGKPMEPVPERGKVAVTLEMNYDTFMQYKKILNDLDKTLCTEKGWRGKSSPESEALRNAVKDVQANLAGKGRIGFNELQTEMEKLTEPLAAYEKHCKDHPRLLNRRKNRLKACGMLRDLQQAARDRKPDPLDTYQREYAGRIMQAAGVAKKNYTETEAKALVDKMMTNPQLRGFLVNQNVFHMKNATDREIGKDMGIMVTKADKFIRKNETKALDQIVPKQKQR